MQINLFERINSQTKYVIEECIRASQLCKIKIYLVGGIVRDILLSNELNDIDITVEGSVNDFAEALIKYSNIQYVKYSETLPTAKVIFSNGIEVDIASTRQEIYKNFGDLPIITQIGCQLKEDVTRRDFTVNALAVSLNEENLFEIIDYLGGTEDLKNKKLRILHEKSFYDDPSRIIRGAKFSQRLSFSLEEKTLKQQNQYLENPLRNIPLFRVKSEILELFSLDNPIVFDNFIKNKLYRILIDYCNFSSSGEKLQSIAKEYALNTKSKALLFFTAIFTHAVPPEKLNLTAQEIKIIKDTHNLLNGYANKNFSDKYSIYKFFRGKEDISLILFASEQNKIITDTYLTLRNKKPIISGKDLQQLGLPQGKIYSEIIDRLTKEKMNNNIENFDEEINFVRKYIHKKGF